MSDISISIITHSVATTTGSVLNFT